MDFGKLLGALDGDDIQDALELLRKNRGLLEQLGRLPDFFASFAARLDQAGDQARAAGLALVGEDGDEGVRGRLVQAGESMAAIAGSLGKGAGLVGDAADGIGKVPLMDAPAKRLGSAADEVGEAVGHVRELAASMDVIAEALAVVGAALGRLGDHLTESGDQARGFLEA